MDSPEWRGGMEKTSYTVHDEEWRRSVFVEIAFTRKE
jgi:hypothetical protein